MLEVRCSLKVHCKPRGMLRADSQWDTGSACLLRHRCQHAVRVVPATNKRITATSNAALPRICSAPFAREWLMLKPRQVISTFRMKAHCATGRLAEVTNTKALAHRTAAAAPLLARPCVQQPGRRLQPSRDQMCRAAVAVEADTQLNIASDVTELIGAPQPRSSRDSAGHVPMTRPTRMHFERLCCSVLGQEHVHLLP